MKKDKTIRIFGSNGHFLYGIPNGSRIRRKESDGTDTVLTLEYMDDYHFVAVKREDKYGETKMYYTYHVMEFGERCRGEEWEVCEGA